MVLSEYGRYSKSAWRILKSALQFTLASVLKFTECSQEAEDVWRLLKCMSPKIFFFIREHLLITWPSSIELMSFLWMPLFICDDTLTCCSVANVIKPNACCYHFARCAYPFLKPCDILKLFDNSSGKFEAFHWDLAMLVSWDWFCVLDLEVKAGLLTLLV